MQRAYTAILDAEISEQIRALAAALEPALPPGEDRGPNYPAPMDPAPMDPDLIDFAIERHRVGPLLQAAARGRPVSTDTQANCRLQDHRASNDRRVALAELEQQRLIQHLSAAAIPVVIFKGVPMARQLYGDAAARHSGDIDVAVPPAQFRAAAAQLCAAGYSVHTAWHASPLSRQGRMSWLSAWLLRDISFVSRHTRQHIELHQRFQFLSSLTAPTEAADPSLRPRLPSAQEPVPTPAPGAAMTLYLLQHGALSGWQRMKWVADMAAALNRLPAAEAARLPALAQACGTAISVRASLALIQAVFGTELPPPLDAWIDQTAGARAVARRLRFYARTLSAPEARTAATSRSRIMAVKSMLYLCDRSSQRAGILLYGTMATAIRQIEPRLRARLG